MSEVISNAFENQQTVTPVKKDVEPSYPYLVYESQQDLDRLEAALTELRKTKTGAQLIADATEHKTPIRLNGAMRAYGSYDEVTNDLKINANNDENRMVGTLAHELRHAQQFQKGILLDAYLDTPKTYIQNQAAIEADASATSCAVCYELALQGNDKPLEALRQKDPHIVNPFQNAAVKGGLSDGSAYQAGFKGWFTDYCTRDSYDILYIKMTRQRRSNCTREEEDKKFERVVPVADVVEKVCTCNGKPYMSRQETEEFFSTPDASTVSFERFNNIFGNCCMKFGLKYGDMENEMKNRLGLTMRPHFDFMPRPPKTEPLPIPTIASRQAQAAEKIAAAKQEKAAENKAKIPFNALLQKRANQGK